MPMRTSRHPRVSGASAVNSAGVVDQDLDLNTNSKQLVIDAGTANDPAIVFGDDDDGSGTGIYRVGANQMGFAVNGGLAAWVSINGLQMTGNNDIVFSGSGNRIYNSATFLNLGDSQASSGHSLGAGDVLVGDKLEVDGNVYLDDCSVIIMANLPVADPTNAGQLWNDAGTLKVSAG